MHASVEGLAQALRAAEHHQSTVKSFVFMSSTAAVFTEKDHNYTFTEADWNSYAENMVAEKGLDPTPRHVVYEASKVAAERELWRFRETKKPKFLMVSINPL